nr:hypothetical protein [Tanacetum cinerariifolium]
MFGVDDLEGDEVFVEKSVEKEVSTTDPVTAAGEVVTTASVEDSDAPTTVTTVDVDDELTLAKTLIAIKAAKPKLEKKRKSRPAGMRRLKKVGTSKQVESSKEKDSLGAQEDASKQRKNIEDIDQDAEIALVDESHGRMQDAKIALVDES